MRGGSDLSRLVGDAWPLCMPSEKGSSFPETSVGVRGVPTAAALADLPACFLEGMLLEKEKGLSGVEFWPSLLTYSSQGNAGGSSSSPPVAFKATRLSCSLTNLPTSLCRAKKPS